MHGLPISDTNTYPKEAETSSFGPSVRNVDSFKSQEMPFPIIVALEREPGQKIVGQNASIFAFDPYEFGSFEPLGKPPTACILNFLLMSALKGGYALGGKIGAFVPVDYVGTRWQNGTADENGCVTGFTYVPCMCALPSSPLRRNHAVGILALYRQRLQPSSTKLFYSFRRLATYLARSRAPSRTQFRKFSAKYLLTITTLLLSEFFR